MGGEKCEGIPKKEREEEMRFRKGFLSALFVFFLLSGCTYYFPYTGVASPVFVEEAKKIVGKNLNYEFSEKLTKFTITGRPSGFVGAANRTTFPIGQTFTSFVTQVLEKDDTKPVLLIDVMEENELRRVSSLRGGFSWIELKLNLSVNGKRITLHKKRVRNRKEFIASGDVGYLYGKLMEDIVWEFLEKLAQMV
ncbi:MAG: hypothetical protein GTN76_01560 [Candidatus Aenigmarchaeota archaeon]|nr:hypothetical protein [Candidatus Aenigmarchaeota archaeon]